MESGCDQPQSGVEQAKLAGASPGTITRAEGYINDMNCLIATTVDEQSAVA